MLKLFICLRNFCCYLCCAVCGVVAWFYGIASCGGCSVRGHWLCMLRLRFVLRMIGVLAVSAGFAV